MAEIIIRNMPRELRQELKIQAAREGRSMTEIIIRLIINYLQEKRGVERDKERALAIAERMAFKH